MFDTITIRLAKPEDAAAIAHFSRKTFFESYAEKNSKKDLEKFLKYQFSVKDLMAEANRAYVYVLLAFNHDILVGYALIREAHNPSELNPAIKAMELARIYVDKSFKGAGIGNALMKECVTLARLKHKEVLWLGVWHENVNAIEFYIKWGFSKFGSKVFLLGDDPQLDWLMKKELQF